VTSGPWAWTLTRPHRKQSGIMRARIPHGWPCDQTAVRWPIHPARGRSNGAIAAQIDCRNLLSTVDRSDRTAWSSHKASDCVGKVGEGRAWGGTGGGCRDGWVVGSISWGHDVRWLGCRGSLHRESKSLSPTRGVSVCGVRCVSSGEPLPSVEGTPPTFALVAHSAQHPCVAVVAQPTYCGPTSTPSKSRLPPTATPPRLSLSLPSRQNDNHHTTPLPRSDLRKFHRMKLLSRAILTAQYHPRRRVWPSNNTPRVMNIASRI
jgi:hypothetical protein